MVVELAMMFPSPLETGQREGHGLGSPATLVAWWCRLGQILLVFRRISCIEAASRAGFPGATRFMRPRWTTSRPGRSRGEARARLLQIHQKGRTMSITAERKTALIKEHAHKSGDTGSPEVQVAILTERINNLTDHFKTHTRTTIPGVAS
jgi:hypothetical protein